MYIYFNISSELLDERLYKLSWFMINLPCLYVVNICHNFIVVVMKRGKEGTEQYYGYNC